MYLERMESTFSENLMAAKAKTGRTMGSSTEGESAAQSEGAPRRGFAIRLTVRTPLSEGNAIMRLLNPLGTESERIAKTIPALDLVGWSRKSLKSAETPAAFARAVSRAGEGEEGEPPPPPDTLFEITWLVAIPQDVKTGTDEAPAREENN